MLLFLATGLAAQQPWTLKKEKDGLRISTRPSDRSKFNDVRVEIDLRGTIAQLMQVLLDVDQYDNWSKVSRNTKIVQRPGPLRLVYYSEIIVPWPATNRDFYATLTAIPDPAKQQLTVLAVNAKDFGPPHKDLIRIPYSKATWHATAQKNGVHLVYVLESDPGGSVPAWILNFFSVKAPQETFENLKKKMESLNP